jgi:S-adenosylmethionine hydrolase
LSSLVCPCVPHPQRKGDTLTGHVVHIDGFWNLIMIMNGKALTQSRVEVLIKSHSINGASRSYSGGAGLLAIVGSHDNLEIAVAVKDGSAALDLDA